MNIDIKNPLELLLEFTYMNGVLNGKEIPELKNINKLMEDIREKLK